MDRVRPIIRGAATKRDAGDLIGAVADLLRAKSIAQRSGLSDVVQRIDVEIMRIRAGVTTGGRTARRGGAGGESSASSEYDAGGDDGSPCSPGQCEAKEFKPVPEDTYAKTVVSDLVGADKIFGQLNRAVIQPMIFPGIYRGVGVQPANVMLYGPGGTGKTRLVLSMMNVMRFIFRQPIPLYIIDAASVKSKFEGQAVQCVRFYMCEANRQPSIILMDEVDALIGSPESGMMSETTAQLQAAFKDAIKDTETQRNAVIVAVTNHPERITDAALKSRFAQRIYVGLPNGNERLMILQDSINRKVKVCGTTPGSVQRVDLGFELTDPSDPNKVFKRDADVSPTARARRTVLRRLTAFMAPRDLNNVADAVAGSAKYGVHNLTKLRYVKRSDGRYDPIDIQSAPAGSLTAHEIEMQGKGHLICWQAPTFEDVVQVLRTGAYKAATSRDDMENYLRYAQEHNDDVAEVKIKKQINSWEENARALKDEMERGN